MSPHSVVTREPQPRLHGVTGWSAALALLGLISAAVMVSASSGDPERAFYSYLIAYMFALTVVLGSLGFIMIGHAANASWPVAVRRLAEISAPAMPLLALLFIPIALGIDYLYPWAHPHRYARAIEHVLLHRRPYMNPTFFVARAAVCLALWSAIAWGLRSGSLRMDEGSDTKRAARRLRRISYAGLPLMVLTAGFAAFDWIMSLAPRFSSSIFGVLFIAMCLLGGIASVTLWSTVARARVPLRILNPSHFYALGRLLLAFLVFLGYVAFFQFLLIWMANRPVEAEWYVDRSYGVYRWIGAFLVFGYLGLPFAILLSYRIKRSATALGWIALWCLVAHYVHLFWLIAPNASRSAPVWTDGLALLCVLSLCGALVLWMQRGKLLAAEHDPRFMEALSYESE